MNWLQKWIDYLFGPEAKPPTPVQVKELLRVPTGTRITVFDAQRVSYNKTVPIQHSYRKGQIIMANLDTWNKVT